MFTAALCTLPFLMPSIQVFMLFSPGIMIFATILAFIVEIAIICNKRLARTVPTNYILLTVFTLCEGYIVAFICTLYEPTVVIAAAFMTAGVVTGLTVYAWNTKSDFTVIRGVFSVLGSAIFMFALMVMIL